MAQRGYPSFATDPLTGAPVTRLYYHLTEATEQQMTDDGGRLSSVSELSYTSPGYEGQAWTTTGLDGDYAALEASLDGNTGPWTDVTAGTLDDATAAGDVASLWIRLRAKRWFPEDAAPTFDFRLRLVTFDAAGVDEA